MDGDAFPQNLGTRPTSVAKTRLRWTQTHPGQLYEGVAMHVSSREELLEAERERWLGRLTALRAMPEPSNRTGANATDATDAGAGPGESSEDSGGAAARAAAAQEKAKLKALFGGPLSHTPWQLRPVTAPKSTSKWSTGAWRGGTARSMSVQSIKTDFSGNLPPRLESAADEFDKRHAVYRAAAEQSLAFAKREPHLDLRHMKFRVATRDMFTNRFVVREDANGDASRAVKPNSTDSLSTPAAKWLDGTIWAARKKRCDSRAFYDSLLCWRSALNRDYARALAAGLREHILSHDHDGGSDEQSDADVIDKVSDALWERHELLYGLFTHYGTHASNIEVFTVTRSACVSFMHTCMIDRKGRQLLNQILTAIDASCAPRDKVLDRHEWLHLIVRIAIAKYLRSSGRSVAGAVRQLIAETIAPRVDLAAIANPNLFRQQQLYVEDVAEVLQRYERTLRRLYACACALDPNADKQSHHALSLSAWRLFLTVVDLTTDDDEDYSEKTYDEDFTSEDGTLCFVWSRMLAIDETDALKQTQLCFEDFLEALVRAAGLKVWPTDEEVAAYGNGNAGTHMMKLERDNPVAFAAMMRYRDPQWGSPPARQSLARCVEHLCQWIIVTLQGGLKRSPDEAMELSERQAC